MAKWLIYFNSPFPSREGFSPYRSPGLLVHIPIIIFFLIIGCLLSKDTSWLMPIFIPLYFVFGLYLGRDLAILAHYNPIITLVIVVLFPIGQYFGQKLSFLFEAFKEFLGWYFIPFSIIFTCLILIGFIANIKFWTKEK
ncbi:MAG: hypothetical protein HQK79_06270 [Desulfobacterales bacterium]|nr:hypothetical protein [Desulfobacterales bacterium]MBF0396672.1 hypothetical protein [Desulfobacterales bacterium]